LIHAINLSMIRLPICTSTSVRVGNGNNPDMSGLAVQNGHTGRGGKIGCPQFEQADPSSR